MALNLLFKFIKLNYLFLLNSMVGRVHRFHSLINSCCTSTFNSVFLIITIKCGNSHQAFTSSQLPSIFSYVNRADFPNETQTNDSLKYKCFEQLVIYK